MRQPGTDPDNVQMSDVLCDFCRREWTEDVPMIEGHQGSCICGRCLTLAYTDIVLTGTPPSYGYRCPMCLAPLSQAREHGQGSGQTNPGRNPPYLKL